MPPNGKQSLELQHDRDALLPNFNFLHKPRGNWGKKDRLPQRNSGCLFSHVHLRCSKRQAVENSISEAFGILVTTDFNDSKLTSLNGWNREYTTHHAWVVTLPHRYDVCSKSTRCAKYGQNLCYAISCFSSSSSFITIIIRIVAMYEYTGICGDRSDEKHVSEKVFTMTGDAL
jgi:hypothetical protein